ncbi:MAG: DNA/RNA nuclease SfsA [Candidatus Atribacteria bacterium]|nr:DNA/RNA nuclease SfsA [Candidatus Atribacteria bacterium]
MSEPLFRIESVLRARFLTRVNRFVVRVEGEKGQFLLSLNNTGRLEKLLREGHTVLFVPHERPKTRGRLVGVEEEDGFVLVDTDLQMKAFEVAFSRGLFPWLSMWFAYRRNPRLGNSVLDYLFVRENEQAYGEVKSALYREGNLALYPDAPTERGRRHLRTLLELQENGVPTYIIFAVALPGVAGCAPFEERDKEVAELLREAHTKGVAVKSFLLSLASPGVVSLEHSDFPVFL